jgi:ABC-type transport system involved in multi-copper enzyme maturation permease subunit
VTGGTWRRQVAVLLRTTMARSLLGRRAAPVLLLAAMPVVLALVRGLLPPGSERVGIGSSTSQFADIFHFFILRFVVFVATAVVFINLFRGEVVERSLHYTLLAPLPRSVLVAGRYLGGLVASVAILGPATVLTFVLYFLPQMRVAPSILLEAPLPGQLLRWLVVMVLACAAYGALFTLAGLRFSNPMLPALLFLGWESLNPFLPPLLKAVSVVHYLDGLTPVPPSVRAFAILGRPPAPWAAVLGLAVIVAVALWASLWCARRLEISYGSD